MSRYRPLPASLLLLGLVGPGLVWPASGAAAETPAPAPAPDQAPTQAPAPAAAATPGTTDAAAVRAAQAAQVELLKDARARVAALRQRIEADPGNAELVYELGALYLDLGDPAAAEESLERAVERGAGAPDLWLLVARAWLLQEKYAEIQTRIDPDNLDGPTEQAALAVIQGLAWLGKERPDEARRRFTEALSLAPDDSSAYLGLARVAMAEGNLTAAAEALDSAVRGVDPQPAEIAMLRGELAMAGKNFATAEQAFQAAVDAAPLQYWRLRALAHSQLARARADAADLSIARLLASRPQDPAGLYLKGYSDFLHGRYQEAFNAMSPLLGQPNTEPGAYLIAGVSSYRLGNFNVTVELLPPYLARQPDDAVARRTLAAAQVQIADAAAALKTLQPLLDGAKPDAIALVIGGVAANLAGDPKAAADYLGRVGPQAGDDPVLARMRGAALLAAGDRKAGLALLAQAVAAGGPGVPTLELAVLKERLLAEDPATVGAAAGQFTAKHPDNAEAWVVQGVAAVRAGDVATAKTAFERALALEPANLDARMGQADLLRREGDLDGAIAAMKAAYQKAPDNPVALSNLLALEFAAGRPEEAVSLAERAAAPATPPPGTIAALAGVYIQAGRPLEALKLLAGRADPKAPGTLALRGQAELRAGQVTRAVESLRARRELEPDSPAALLDLARALTAAGQYPEAIDLYKKVKARVPGSAEAAIGISTAEFRGLPIPIPDARLKAVMPGVGAVLKQYPADPDAMRLQALAVTVGGRPRDAVALLQPLYQATLDAETLIDLANAQVRAADIRAAETALSGHLKRFPGDIAVRTRYAALLKDQGQRTAAADQFKRILEQDWSRTDAHLDLAETLIQAGQTAAAEPHLRAAEQADPKDPRLKALRASAGPK